MTRAEIIDTHVHLWDAPPYDWEEEVLNQPYRVGDLTRMLDAHGVTAAIAVQAVHEVTETEWLLSLAASHDRLIGVVGWTDLESDAVEDDLDKLLSAPAGAWLVGIRHLTFFEPDGWLSRPSVRRGLAAMAERALTFDLLVPTDGVAGVVAVAKALPQLRIVVDHLGNGPLLAGDDAGWRVGMTALARLPNVACKVSELTTLVKERQWGVDELRDAVSFVVDAFGASRVLFGSDWPVCLTAGSVDDVLRTARQQEALHESAPFFADNARQWYPIR